MRDSYKVLMFVAFFLLIFYVWKNGAISVMQRDYKRLEDSLKVVKEKKEFLYQERANLYSLYYIEKKARSFGMFYDKKKEYTYIGE